MKEQKRYPAAVCCVIALVLMVIALLTGGGQKSAPFVPPEFESKAVSGVPDVPGGLGWSELDVQVFRASVCGVIRLQDSAADIWLTNPAGSEVWIKLRMLDENGVVLGETGLLRPGEYVRSVTLNSVPKPGTGIVLKLMAYEPETYRSAGAVSVSTTIE